jgi:hypothetical protein
MGIGLAPVREPVPEAEPVAERGAAAERAGAAEHAVAAERAVVSEPAVVAEHAMVAKPAAAPELATAEPPAPERPARRDRAARAGREGDVPAHAPLAGEPKIQVNPRIYQRTWRRYEELVDLLPRERRRGALTALVNAVLVRHAPEDLAEVQAELAWLRRAEVRDA